MKSVGVVILNFKVKEYTLECIKSVKNSTYKNIKIIAVDNNSEDGIGEILQFNKDLIFIQNKENTGFTGGNNLGIKKALELGMDYILVLNPDTTVEKNAIEILVEALDDNDAGIVCPKILLEDRETIWFAGKDLDLLNVLGNHRGVDKKDEGGFESMEETDATGAAMMVKKEVFDKIGLFDERYFLYYDDSDFSFRAKKGGFKILYIPKAKVYHANGRSTGLGSPLQDYYITRNRMLFASKFLPLRTRFALFREVLKNIGKPARRLALWDFLIGNFRKGSYR